MSNGQTSLKHVVLSPGCWQPVFGRIAPMHTALESNKLEHIEGRGSSGGSC